MRKIVEALVLGAIALLPATARADKPIVTIGWSGPLTGDSAVLGVDSRKAVEMVFESANSLPTAKVYFKLAVEDDQYNTAKSLTAYRRLASIEKAQVVIFLTYGGLFSVAPQALRDRVLIVDPLDCNDEVAKLPQSVVCVAAMTDEIGRLNAQMALQSGSKRGAILYFADDPFMSTVAKSTEAALRASGNPIVLSESYSARQSDFRTLLLKAKANGADALYIYGYDEAANIMKQARQLGMTTPFFSTATVFSPPFIAAAGTALDGTRFSVFTPSDERRYADFRERFQKRYGAAPILDIATVPSFDIANLIVGFTDEFKGAVGSARYYDELKSFLSSVRSYDGASGKITIDRDGATRSLTMRTYEVRQGARHVIPFPK
jgi:branched-chain amino acid transport system substrate-binding protein